ncbi:MAG: 3-keto-disaccharide hydrolase [Acidobacteriota bacterium]
MKSSVSVGAVALLVLVSMLCVFGQKADGFVTIYNGQDFTGWKVPAGDNGHWKIVDGVIDYDAQSEAATDKNLWTEKEYGDFTLRVDWRIKATPWKNPRVPLIMPDGSHKLDENGKEIQLVVPDSDSGIILRGQGKSQVNIWCWPIGSGEVYGYRMDKKMPAEVRAGATPRTNADKNIGEWNTFEITVRGERLNVVLNGKTVIDNALLPEIPKRGPIGLQHHGGKRDGEWNSPPSLVQFRNISIKELK